jgi:hypothetical protein
MDIERTMRTLQAQGDVETAKAEIFRQLAEAELAGHDADGLAGVLMQLGLAISLATAGPTATVSRMAIFMKTLADMFPAEWAAMSKPRSGKRAH